ncbi:metallophosphoesterase family protein [Halobacteriovorax marinus]|uniref:metallophosphoesterase family protein n=1 Tax=Halobacteriovorax marinus TaxID=97084 RepID=UPI003A90E96E
MKLERRNSKKLIFFGGAYSNLEATIELKNILDSQKISPKDIFCTGDILAYCADPNETIEVYKEWGINSIYGNVEEQLVGDQENCGCNFKEGTECDILSRNWYEYIRSNITEESMSYLRTLPATFSIKFGDHSLRIIHGGVNDISKFFFKETPTEFFEKEVAPLVDEQIVIAGHSGIPFLKELKNHYWINAGVIGMPANDGTTRAWYLELTLEDGLWASLHSFSYNSKSTSEKMNKKNLPSEYASTLINGIWPNQDIIPIAQRDSQGIALKEEKRKIK